MKLLGVCSLTCGVVGGAAGIAAVATSSVWLCLLAALGALGAAAAGGALYNRARRHDLDLASTRMRLAQLEQATAEQIQARLAAEADAKQAEERAQKAQMGSSMLADRLRTIRARGATTRKDLTDSDTGLYGEEYFTATVDARVASARRHLRPLTVVLIEVVTGLGGGSPRPADAKMLAAALVETVREADTACRLVDGRFALVLEDTPENGAIWTVERFRRQIVKELHDVTVWAGVAGYPAHAFDADSVVRLSERALVSAKEWGQDRIEVAPTS